MGRTLIRFLRSCKPFSLSRLCMFLSGDAATHLSELPHTRKTVKPYAAMLNWRLPLQLILLTAAFTALYYPVVVSLVRQWMQDPNYSYGFFVPLFSALWCWMHRDAWMRCAIFPSNSGLIVIAMALALLVIGMLGAEVFLQRISLIMLLGGLVAYFAGWKMLRGVLAPILFLFLMVPLPAIIFNEVAFPLQLLASRLSAFCLSSLHVPVVCEGNVIILPSITLDIAEACSGIRSLMSLATLAIIYGSFAERRNWMRWVLAILAVPIAVMANALRIVGAAIFGYYWGPRFAEGFFHSFSGWLVFVLALSLLILLHKLGLRLTTGRAAT